MQVNITREKLREVARQLRPRRSMAKLNVVEFSQAQGISTVLRTGDRYSSRQGTLVYGPPPKITIYRHAREAMSRVLEASDNQFLTNAERFSIAHEVGHWILWDRFGVEPSVNRSAHKENYWWQEKLVNAFAGSVLVPEWFIFQRLEETESDGFLIANSVISLGRGIGCFKGSDRFRDLSIQSIGGIYASDLNCEATR